MALYLEILGKIVYDQLVPRAIPIPSSISADATVHPPPVRMKAHLVAHIPTFYKTAFIPENVSEKTALESPKSRGLCVSISSAATTSRFTHFKSLPPEIRANIWRCSLPGPRMVTVRFLETKVPRPVHLTIPLLSCCVESREEVLRVYKPLFKSASGHPDIYVDLKRDLLLFSEVVACIFHAARDFDAAVLEQLGSLAFGMHLIQDICNQQTARLRDLSKFQGLQDILLMPQTTVPSSNQIETIPAFKTPLCDWPKDITDSELSIMWREDAAQYVTEEAMNQPRTLRNLLKVAKKVIRVRPDGLRVKTRIIKDRI